MSPATAVPQALNVSGIYPHLGLSAELGPPRTECGVGALFAWAGRLWVLTYVSHKSASGVGTGFYEIDEHLNITKRPESYVGTYTGRYVHWPSNQLIFGPYVIDAAANVRVIEPLLETRVCSAMEHLEDPAHMVYLLGMEGEFFEMNVYTLEVRHLFDLTAELPMPPGAMQDGRPYVHFKAGYSGFGRVIVANNTYYERDLTDPVGTGHLAEWDGREWRVLEHTAFVDVTARGRFSGAIFATGWDKASAILKVYTHRDQTWRTYRLPKASHCFDHMWQTEWPRIREVEHERFLMDCHGMFYELSPWAYGNRIWGVRPISTHLWVLGDFCTYRGMLVLGCDNASPHGGANHLAGEPQSNLWFGKTDDLWGFGKPAGWGGPWWEQTVVAGQPSDPYLMTGFEHKVLHLTHEASEAVTFSLEVDFLGCGKWKTYDAFTVPPGGYVHHEFPAGFSAHWVRVTASQGCVATAYLTYT